MKIRSDSGVTCKVKELKVDLGRHVLAWRYLRRALRYLPGVEEPTLHWFTETRCGVHPGGSCMNAFMTPGMPEVWIRADVPLWDLKRLVKHELGHHYGMGEHAADRYAAGHFGPVLKRTRFRITFPERTTP